MVTRRSRVRRFFAEPDLAQCLEYGLFEFQIFPSLDAQRHAFAPKAHDRQKLRCLDATEHLRYCILYPV